MTIDHDSAPRDSHRREESRPTIMTLDEVANYLRVHRSTVYRMARERSIPTTKVANQWRFKKERIDSWLLEREGLDEVERERSLSVSRR